MACGFERGACDRAGKKADSFQAGQMHQIDSGRPSVGLTDVTHSLLSTYVGNSNSSRTSVRIRNKAFRSSRCGAAGPLACLQCWVAGSIPSQGICCVKDLLWPQLQNRSHYSSDLIPGRGQKPQGSHRLRLPGPGPGGHCPRPVGSDPDRSSSESSAPGDLSPEACSRSGFGLS